MFDNEKRYKYLIEAFYYHSSQFNLWMAFFIAINGGLLLAYTSDGLKCAKFEKILIVILGYIASLSFHCGSKGYRFYIKNFLNLIRDHEKKYIKNADDGVHFCFKMSQKWTDYFHPTRPANILVFKIVSLFSFFLTYAWGILLIQNIFQDMKNFLQDNVDVLTIVLAIGGITIINMVFLYIAMLFLSNSPADKVDLESDTITVFEKNVS